MSARRPPGAVDLSVPTRIHLVGVGGAGMSAIATILLAMGHTVSGSDRRGGPGLDRLAAAGVEVHVGHHPRHVGGAGLVAASSAVPATNAEVVEARRRPVTFLWRDDLLAAICATRKVVAVAGTKGKSTTTAMVAGILEAAGWRPSFLVGADVPGAEGGARWVPGSEWLVVEADESDGTFLHLPTEAVVVTGVEADHVDTYGDFGGLEAAFAAFVRAAPGPKVVGVDTPASAALARATGAVTYGTAAGAGFRAVDVRSGRFSASFALRRRDRPDLVVELGVPGLHNVRNATGALAAAVELGVAAEVAVDALASFRPVGRRFEWRGDLDGVTLIDDYAHLPGALALVLETARGGGWGRVVAVFQPHLYSRTAALHGEMGAALAAADVVVVTDVYPAREAPQPGVDGRLVADAVAAARPGADVHYVPERSEVAAVVADLLRPGDLCLTLGAGDITTVADELMAAAAPPGPSDPAARR